MFRIPVTYKATKKDFQSSEYIMFRIPVTCAPVAFPGYMCAYCLPYRGQMLAAWAQPGAVPNATQRMEQDSIIFLVIDSHLWS